MTQKLLLKQRNYSEQRSPTLNTVIMVEEVLKEQDEIITIPALKRILPKQVMHQTLMTVLDYLEYSGKITMHDEKLLWTFKPSSKLKRLSPFPIR